MARPSAFLCYARADDEYEGGKISWFKNELEQSVRFLGVESFEIFQDRDSIEYSERWREVIDGAIDASALLIPILTNRWFTRDECRRELERFREREDALGRDDLVLGVSWHPADVLVDPVKRASDELAADLASRQLVQWHEVRHSTDQTVVRRRLEEVAERIKQLVTEEGSTSVRASLPGPPRIAVSGASAVDTARGGATVEPESTAVEPPTRVVDPFPNRGDHTTITAAIDAAAPGDRIVVRPGVYDEALFIDEPIEVVGDGPVEQIVVRASGANAVHMTTTVARVAGLTLRQVGEETPLAAVFAASGRLLLEDCVVTSGAHSGISVMADADPVIRRNVIVGSKYHGVDARERAGGLIEGNQISRNGYSGVGTLSGAGPTVRNNRIFENRENGVFVSDGGLGAIEENSIERNGFSGIEIATGANPTVRANQIVHNLQAGLSVREDGLGLVEDNDIANNGSSGRFAGIDVSTRGSPVVRDNRIVQNTGNGVWVHDGGSGEFEGNTVTGNGLGSISLDDDATATVTENVTD